MRYKVCKNTLSRWVLLEKFTSSEIDFKFWMQISIQFFSINSDAVKHFVICVRKLNMALSTKIGLIHKESKLCTNFIIDEKTHWHYIFMIILFICIVSKNEIIAKRHFSEILRNQGNFLQGKYVDVNVWVLALTCTLFLYTILKHTKSNNKRNK